MKKLTTTAITVCCIFWLCGCSPQKEDVKILVAPADKPELVKETTDPPPGFSVEYNTQTGCYRWCYPNSTVCFGTYAKSRIEAVRLAWEQFDYEQRNAEKNWKRSK